MKKTGLLLFLLSFAINAGAGTREPAVSGRFYPSDKKELSGFVSRALKSGTGKISGEITGLLVPHAGYEFSGRVAAAAYSAVEDDYDIVVLIGPSHRTYVKNAAIYPEGFFKTPMGKVKVDEKITRKLIESGPLFSENRRAHSSEHSLEVQLPFLQSKLKKGFEIVPVLVNAANPARLREMARILVKALKGKKALLVASSDFSHYPPAAVAEMADKTMLAAIPSMDSDYLMRTEKALLEKRVGELNTAACGKSALGLLMEFCALEGCGDFRTIEYSHSFAENPAQSSSSSVVGYAAGVFLRGERDFSPFVLKPSERKEILNLARKAILSELEGKEIQTGLSPNAAYNLPAAVFVTLEKDGNLRGCIGTTAPRLSLNDAVAVYAKAAAFSDSRFRPVKKDEMEEIKIEISILTPLRKAASAREIISGKHGVVVQAGGKSGLFLPQVWGKIEKKENFLSELCVQKAGLPPDCWKDGKTDLFIFSVYSFEEENGKVLTR